MWVSVWFTAAVVLLASCFPSLPEMPWKAPADAQAIEGHWKVVGLERDGKMQPVQRDDDAYFEWRLKDGAITVLTPRGTNESRILTFTEYRLDPDRSPKHIHLHVPEMRACFAFTPEDASDGIYELRGDELRIAYRLLAEPGTRPAHFRAQPGRVGVLLLRRIVEEDTA